MNFEELHTVTSASVEAWQTLADGITRIAIDTPEPEPAQEEAPKQLPTMPKVRKVKLDPAIMNRAQRRALARWNRKEAKREAKRMEKRRAKAEKALNRLLKALDNK